MKKNIILAVIMALVLGVTASVHAVPTLQVGAPAGPGDTGTYADYSPRGTILSNPTEEETAVIGGSTLYVAGAFGSNDIYLGGTCPDALCHNAPGVDDWSDFGYNSLFNGHGALLMATVANGTLASGSLLVDGFAPIYTTSIYEDGFKVPSPPSNHDPIKNQDYLFFDIGSFSKISRIPNLSSETLSNQWGEIKTLDLDITGYDWIHFDVFALVTDQTTKRGRFCSTIYDTDAEGNPGSKDVTWKTQQVPEPSTLLLLGLGLLSLGVVGRKVAKGRR